MVDKAAHQQREPTERERVCAALAMALNRVHQERGDLHIGTELEVSPAYVFKLLRGERFPSPEMLVKMRKRLGLDVNGLLDAVPRLKAAKMLGNRETYQELLFSKSIEGGVSNRPLRDDPGGLTNHGVTKKLLAEWRDREVSDHEVHDLTLDEAKAILAAKFWNPLRCNDLPGGIDAYLCDFGWNSGMRRAAKRLQVLLGFENGEIDGFVGPATLRAVGQQDPATLLQAMHDDRLRYLRGLKNWEANKNGWRTRCEAMLALAQTMLPAEGKSPELVAKSESAKRTIATTIATIGTTVTAAVPVIVATLPSAKDAYERTREAAGPLAEVAATLGPVAAVAPYIGPAFGVAVLISVLYLAVRNATMQHNAKVTGAVSNIVASTRLEAERSAA